MSGLTQMEMLNRRLLLPCLNDVMDHQEETNYKDSSDADRQPRRRKSLTSLRALALLDLSTGDGAEDRAKIEPRPKRYTIERTNDAIARPFVPCPVADDGPSGYGDIGGASNVARLEGCWSGGYQRPSDACHHPGPLD